MENKQSNNGILFGVIAYLLWGVSPLYWKLIEHTGTDVILAYRIIWSLIFMLLLIICSGMWKSFKKDLKVIMSEPKQLLALILASTVISLNWFTYIWAVNNNHIVESSLGYYINPLVSVLLGIIVLKERLNFWQLTSFLIAGIGVVIMSVHNGTIPWISLILAVSFGLYGLAKKLTNYGAFSSLTLESMVIAPFAILYLIFFADKQTVSLNYIFSDTGLLLAGAGVVTALPLLFFGAGTRRIPLYLMGFLQYIAPTISLMIGVFLYDETFSKNHVIAFVCIWISLVLFSISNTRFLTRYQPQPKKSN